MLDMQLSKGIFLDEICDILYEIYICICPMYNIDSVKYRKGRIYAHSETCLNGGTTLYKSLISLSHIMKIVTESRKYLSVSCLMSRSAWTILDIVNW